MIRAKKLTMLIILVILQFVEVHGQVSSLNDAISAALKNNDKIKQYQEKLIQKEYQNLEAWGNFLPTIDFQASYNHLNDPMSIDLSPIKDVIVTLQSKNQVEFANIYNLMQGQAQLTNQQRSALFSQYSSALDGSIPDFVETFKKQDYKTATLIGVQPLFLGGKLYAAKKFASDELDASNIEMQKIRDEVIQETVNNYLSVVLMQNVVSVRKDVLSGIVKHRDDAKRIYEEGLIANHNLLRAEVAVAEAERNLSDDENRLDLAKIALRHSIGYSEDNNIAIADTLVFTNVSDSLQNYLEKAFANQPILKLISKKKDAASDKYIAERANFLPTLAAFGKYEMYPEYLSSLEPRWVVGLQLKFNIFNGLKDYSKLQNAVHLEREINYIEADARRKIDLWVNKSFKDVSNSRTRYNKLEKTIELAEENLRLNNKRFQSGMGTSLEVIDAQLSYEKVKIERLQSLYDYYKSLTDLFVASGNAEEILQVWNKEN